MDIQVKLDKVLDMARKIETGSNKAIDGLVGIGMGIVATRDGALTSVVLAKDSAGVTYAAFVEVDGGAEFATFRPIP